MSSPQQPIDIATFNTEARRVISAHSRHFLTLTVLFLLPLFFLITISSTLHSLLLLPSHSHLHALTLTFLFPFILCLFISAAASISHSTFHGFFGLPVKLPNALRSVLHSFLPLLFTTLLSALVQFSISAIAVTILFCVVKGFEFVGIGNGTVDFDVVYVLLSAVVIGFGLLCVLVYLNVNWALICVVVVVEGRWGVSALRRSVKLVKGMRWITVRVVLYFGYLIGFFVWAGVRFDEDLQELSSSWVKGLGFVVRTVVMTAILAFFMFNSLVAHTVLYLYAKASSGENVEEFEREYVSLPFDEENVPHLVSVVRAA